ncbi:MAG: proton-conducting transporter membrane subunit [Thermaerobacter sp.]|nr:proton-conducting transporter membrane subunit [Thermaerobacter sp.]
MTGLNWVQFWGGLAALGLVGGGILDAYQHWRKTRYWLGATLMVGSVALVVMGAGMNQISVIRVAMPTPFPTLTLAPLPLASLWAVVAGLLFFAAALGTWSHPQGRQVFYSLVPLQAAVGLFLWSGDGLYLLATWEVLSVLGYLGLVTTRRARPVWHAGWVLLALSEFGGMLLFAGLLFLTSWHGSGFHDSFARMAILAHNRTLVVRNAVMVLVLLAFGVKAGLFPLMIWMPLAEPEAPGAVAGIFSGLLTALAVSAILAMDRIVHPGIVWGVVLVILGTMGALSAALYSIVSRHLKRVLAYSTLEILGIVFAALGIWQLAGILNPTSIAAKMALDGAVILLVMHAGSKFLLFLSTDYFSDHSQLIDRLGGRIHRARWLAGITLGAIVIIGAIPPLGGFVGEWLIIESLFLPFNPAAVHLLLLAVAALLAMTMALGVTAYLRWYAFIFLGPSHSPDPAGGSGDVGGLMKWGLLLGLIPGIVAGPGEPWLLPWISRQLTATHLLAAVGGIVARTKHPIPAVKGLIPLGANLLPVPGAAGSVFFPQGASVGDPWVLFWMALTLMAVIYGIRGWRRPPSRQVNPWTGGSYPFARDASFSAEGFVHPLRLAFAGFYGLKRERKDKRGSRLYRHTIVDRVERHLYLPLILVAKRIAQGIRAMQNGSLAIYLSYLGVSVLVSIMLFRAWTP